MKEHYSKSCITETYQQVLIRGHLQTKACTLNIQVTLLQDPPPLNVMNEYSSVLYFLPFECLASRAQPPIPFVSV